MTREIKLRAKITHGENSGKWKYVIIGEDAIGTAFSEKSIYFNNEDCIKKTVGQFTGLKDKNGKEIYEGDVLEIKTESGRVERFKVEWGIHRREMKSGYTVDIPSFAFVSDTGIATFPIVDNYNNGHDLDIIEVIGNIHE